MSGRNIEAGHCYALKETVNASWPRYRESAQEQGVKPVSRKVYARVLVDKVSARACRL